VSLSRRDFGLALAGAGVAGAAGLAALSLRRMLHGGDARRVAPGIYGPLVRDPRGLLDLPAGFAYRIVQTRGERMSDGHIVPWQPDAMACFPGDDPSTIVLLRNHECGTDAITGPWAPGQSPSPLAYTPHGMGGVSRVVLDRATLAVRSSNLVLAGTLRNCAGGPSPWGWVSCEENTEPGHGYAFLCPAGAHELQPPRRLDGYGRFRHEACAVDPDTNVAYLSEDQGDGCFYRFVPARRETPFAGRLQALAVAGAPGFDTADGGWPVGTRVPVAWIDLPDPTPAIDDLRLRARAAGAARVRRGEGLTWSHGGVYLAATTGGLAQRGQIFRYTPDRADAAGGTLELFAEAEHDAALRMPDNLTVAPSGHVFACEDNGEENHLRVFGPEGACWDFARNAFSSGEFAGVCFAPDGETLFVNLQDEGWTFAIRGPFAALRTGRAA
jgi:secreted PhoX family phosphatase